MTLVMSTLLAPLGNRSIQMIIVNLVIYVDFLITLKTDPFDVTRFEKRLRIFNQYLISICFLNLIFYDGRFIAADELSEDGKQEEIFSGLIKNATIHYNYGQVQTVLFLISAASCLAL